MVGFRQFAAGALPHRWTTRVWYRHRQLSARRADAGGISMYYDVGQGQGWERNIVMDGSPHLPPGIRQWFGDSRSHWDGDTLVVDVTDFSPKTDAFGSRENRHLIERWTRTGPTTLAYEVTVEDPTVWTQPWTVKAGVEQAKRPGEPDLYRTTLH